MTYELKIGDDLAYTVKCTDRGCYFYDSKGKPTSIPSVIYSLIESYVTNKGLSTTWEEEKKLIPKILAHYDGGTHWGGFSVKRKG